MEKTDNRLIEMSCSEIDSFILKNANCFLTTKEIASHLGKAEWSDYGHMKAALDKMVQQGKLEFDDVHGYCRKGQKVALRQELSKPSLPRSEFDKLTPSEQLAHIKAGNRVV